MNPPGIPAFEYQPDVEPDDAARSLLAALDKTDTRAIIVAMPIVDPDDDDQVDQLEDRFRAVYDLAKAERPDLCIKVIHALDAGQDDASRIVCAVHEHLFIGGECVRGCSHTRSISSKG